MEAAQNMGPKGGGRNDIYAVFRRQLKSWQQVSNEQAFSATCSPATEHPNLSTCLLGWDFGSYLFTKAKQDIKLFELS